MRKRTVRVLKERRPEFLELSERECLKVLGRNRVGRLAFVRGRGVDIEPIGYAQDRDWLYLRSAWGTKIEAIEHNPYVAFEVDEIDGPVDWRSVVAHGTIYMLPSDATSQRREYERAVAALRRHDPSALRADDKTPQRDIVYGVHVDQLSGRRARSRARARQ